jgi:hypothetical protein
MAVLATFATLAGSASGQNLGMRATITGSGSPDRGVCTIEVLADGAAEVDIRGGNATLRNLSGRPPQWRRFECTGLMPNNPTNFRFRGLDGRGSQELVRGPQNGGPAVVRIQDPQGGAEGYTFALSWGGDGGGNFQTQHRGGIDGYSDHPNGQRFTADQAVRVCQEAVQRQALERFHSENIAFRKTTLDDNPGRQDWIKGRFDVRRGYDRDEAYRFSCSVNFETGEVRSAQIDPIERDGYGPGNGNAERSESTVAMNGCQRAVEERVRQRGYQHVDFLSIQVDDRPGRNDWIVGTARADTRSRSDSFAFSCSVDLHDGDVKSADIHRQ